MPTHLKLRQDFRLTADVLLRQGMANVSFQIDEWWRNLYMLEFWDSGLTLRQEIAGGRLVQLGQHAEVHQSDQWYTVTITCQDDMIEVAVDGTPVSFATNDSPLLRSRFAFAAFQDADVQFDNVRVESPASNLDMIDQGMTTLAEIEGGTLLLSENFDSEPLMDWVLDAKWGCG